MCLYCNKPNNHEGGYISEIAGQIKRNQNYSWLLNITRPLLSVAEKRRLKLLQLSQIDADLDAHLFLPIINFQQNYTSWYFAVSHAYSVDERLFPLQDQITYSFNDLNFEVTEPMFLNPSTKVVATSQHTTYSTIVKLPF